MDGKVVLVTGGTSGIGKATATALAGMGAEVVVTGRNRERGEGAVEEIRRDSGDGKASLLLADLAVQAEVRRLAREFEASHERLDVLVNNAGVMLLGPINGADTEEWRRMVDANVYGVLYCTHAALPLMAQQGSGHIVNVSSVAGRIARAGSGVYNLTKHGVGAFSEALRQEAVSLGVRVTLIEPGAVATELPGHNRPEIIELMAKNFAGVTPLDAEDIAGAIVYAISQGPNVSVNEILVRPSAQVR
jgi:NADP-dependent 3-hydroxy acid dehydrogenase YdfG